jgi:hypothetical protein
MSPSLEQYSCEPSQEIYESRISSEKNQQLEIGPYFAIVMTRRCPDRLNPGTVWLSAQRLA